MFALKSAAAPMPRYQTIRGAHSTARPLTPYQKFLLALCDSPVTLADLAAATRVPASEISQALSFLRAHALVKSTTPA